MNWISLVVSGFTSLFKTSDGKNPNYLVIILMVASFIFILTIGYLQGQIKDLQKELAVCNVNVKLLQTTIDEQNDAIEASRADYKLISEEFGRLGNALDERYSKIVVQQNEKFRAATCQDKLDMIKASFEDFKKQLNIEIRREYENKTDYYNK